MPSGDSLETGFGARPLLAVTLKMISVAVFVGMSTSIKLTGVIPAGQIVFYRSLFAVVPIFIFLAFRRELSTGFRTKRPLGHIVRGLVGVASMYLGFFALTRLPLPEVITMNYAQPLIVVALSALFLGETVRLYRWSAVVVGLIGVVIIAWPKLTLFAGGRAMESGEALGVAAVLISAAISAVAMLLVRQLVRTEASATIVLWFSITCAAFGLATLPFGWADLSVTQVALLITAGLCGGVGQILMTESYRHGDMSIIAPFEYTSMLLGIVVGYLVFNDVPTVHMLVGGAVVVGAGIFVIWREHQLGLERGRARRLVPPQG
jgi:drug/metabolite transporter (DMT)-like permease